MDRLIDLMRSRPLGIFFFISAAIIFSNYFIELQAVLASTDLLFNHYPNLIFGHQSLRAGYFGLWNPYIFAGIDFTSSFHNHMLHPVNWVLVLAPEKWIFHVLTLRIFLEISLIGYVAFKIARLYHRDSTIAFLVAIVAQLGGFTWFTVTTLIGTHLLAISLIAIYLILTLSNRDHRVAFILLTICFADILLMGHIGYILAFGFPIILVFIWRTWPHCLLRPWAAETAIIIAAAFTGLLLAAYRLIPILHGLIYEQVGLANIGLPTSLGINGYFALTGFIPEAFGIHLGEATNLFGPLGVVGRHTQFHNLLYFGIVPLIILYFALARGFDRKTFLVALVTSIIAIVPLELIAPFSDIFSILFFPAHHEIIPRTLFPFLLIFTISLALAEFSKDTFSIKEEWLRGLILVTGVVLAVLIAFYTRAIPDSLAKVIGADLRWFIYPAKISLITVLVVFLLIAFRWSLDLNFTNNLTNIAASTYFVIAFFAGFLILKEGIYNQWIVLRDYFYSAGLALWIMTVILLARKRASLNTNTPSRDNITLAGAAITLIILLIPIPEMEGSPRTSGAMLAPVLGAFKFILLTFATIELLNRWRLKDLKKEYLVLLLTILTIGDLLFFNKIYSHVGTSPFVTSVFPERKIPGLPSQAETAYHSSIIPNVLSNPDLSIDKNNVDHWNLGGHETRFKREMAERQEGFTVQVVDDNGGSLFQDVLLPSSTRIVSFGAWVKTNYPNKVKALLTSENIGVSSPEHTGSGKWEWLMTTFESNSGDDLETVRPHIVITGKGNFTILNPKLVLNDQVAPDVFPDPNLVLHTKSLDLALNGPPTLDLSQYRVNNPNHFIQYHHSTLSNIPMVYKLPTYGGVDSDVKSGIIELIKAFEQTTPWVSRAGITPKSTNQKLLDILGVKYEFIGPKEVEVRPNALARLALFHDFKIATSFQNAIEILKEDSIDLTSTVTIEGTPNWEFKVEKHKHFEPIEYHSPSTSKLEANLKLDAPAILLFNDSYSPHWNIYFQGKKLPLLRTNANFMGAFLPKGDGQLVLEFEPQPFLALVRLSLSISIALAIFSLLLFLKIRKSKNCSTRPSNLLRYGPPN